MGWSFSYFDIGRKAHIESLTNQRHFSSGYTPITHRVVGNHVWQLVQKPDGTKFICLDLIAKERKCGWGYKGMSEDAGPYYYSCPATLLDAADPPATENAAEWREKVRAYHERQKRLKAELASLKPGTTLVEDGNQYTLLEDLGRSGWRVRDRDGGQGRLPLKYIRRLVEEKL